VFFEELLALLVEAAGVQAGDSRLTLSRASAQWSDMTATLEEIHRDPAILDRAIARGESLEIIAAGALAATMVPRGSHAEPDFLERARRIWGEAPVGKPLSELVTGARD
jgi:hypothetical protein